MLAFGAADGAIILGSYSPAPTTIDADTVNASAINFGDEDLDTYNTGTWTPAITGSGGNPTISYTTQTGQYTQIGNVVFYTATIVISTISSGSGDARFSMPASVAVPTVGTANLSGVDVGASTVHINFAPVVSTSYGRLRETQDNAAITATQISALGAGDTIAYAGFYFTT
jgi:hypothetical protein